MRNFLDYTVLRVLGSFTAHTKPSPELIPLVLVIGFGSLWLFKKGNAQERKFMIALSVISFIVNYI